MMDVDIIGNFPNVDPNCAGCGKSLLLENAWMTDGCPCNTPLGVNSMNETRWRLLMQLQQKQSFALSDLRRAAEQVLAGLNQRIEQAPADAVPVFHGIAELHSAIAATTK